MWPRTSWSLSSLTLNIVFGRASTISPSISIFSSLATGVRLDQADTHRLRSLVADFLLVLDLGVLGQALEALAVDARVVHEEVAIALVGGDEAVALLVVEPLDGSGRHVEPLPACARSVRQANPNHGTCCRIALRLAPCGRKGISSGGVSARGTWHFRAPPRGTSKRRPAGPRCRTGARRSPPCARRRRGRRAPGKPARSAWWHRAQEWARRPAAARSAWSPRAAPRRAGRGSRRSSARAWRRRRGCRSSRARGRGRALPARPRVGCRPSAE